MIHSIKKAATRSMYVDHAMDFFDSIRSYLRWLLLSGRRGANSVAAKARRQYGAFPHS